MTDLYRQHFSIDADDKRDVTWEWSDFTTDRGTSIDSAVILADGAAIGDSSSVTELIEAQVDGTTVTGRYQISAKVTLTCRATFANGERKDHSFYFTVGEH